MDGYDIREAMEQVHISAGMQEEMITNIRNRMEHGYKSAGRRSRKKMAVTAAAFALATGIIGFPVRALVTNVVTERMENVPGEELTVLNDMVQSQHVLADGFSREYTDSEKERGKALRQAYKSGRFPEKAIAQVDSAEEAKEGSLCYIRSTGVFHLPAEELTDEELLEIIDFQHKMSYAVSQGPQAQAARAKSQEKAARLEKIVQDADGISGNEAVEIAKRQLKTDLGDRADTLKLMTDSSGSGACLLDASDFSEVEFQKESRAGVIYDVSFGDTDTRFIYGYFIDALDGRILYTYD